MTSKNIRYSIYFSSSFIKFIFLTLTIKSWRFLWLSICILPHLGSSVIHYHIYASALFISPKTNTAYLNIEVYWHKWPQKFDIKMGKKNFYHLLRTSMSRYVSQNISACIWNRHNPVNLVFSFPCKCNLIYILSPIIGVENIYYILYYIYFIGR